MNSYLGLAIARPDYDYSYSVVPEQKTTNKRLGFISRIKSLFFK